MYLYLQKHIFIQIYIYICIYICIYIYIYIYITYITLKEWSIKRGFAFKEEQNNVIFTIPEDCASTKLRFA